MAERDETMDNIILILMAGLTISDITTVVIRNPDMDNATIPRWKATFHHPIPSMAKKTLASKIAIRNKYPTVFTIIIVLYY